VKPREMMCFIDAMAGVRIHLRQPEEVELLAIPQRSNRHTAESSEVSDVEHDDILLEPSRCGRVKTWPESSPDRQDRAHAEVMG
jgi:hypothetical protein